MYICICRIKTHDLFEITNTSLLFRSFGFTLIKHLKRTGIFVILNKSCGFILHILLSNALKVEKKLHDI